MTSLTAQHRLDLSNYELVWSDEFDTYTGTQDDIRKLLFDDVDAQGNPNDPKWSSGNSFPNQFTGGDTATVNLIERENVEVHNGKLYLKSKEESGIYNYGGTLYPYRKTSALIRSNYDKDYLCVPNWDGGDDILCNQVTKGFHYGIFEIRAKLPRLKGDLSSFWMWSGYGQCGDPGSDGYCTEEDLNDEVSSKYLLPGYEIDVFEASQIGNDVDDGGEGRNWNDSEDYNEFNYWSTIQANQYTQPTPCRHCATYYDWNNSDPGKEFHTYTLAWTPEKVTWFIDGNEIRSDYKDGNGGIPPFKMTLILMTLNHYIRDGAPFIIDYVRVYKPSSVDYTTSTAYCNKTTPPTPMGQYTWSSYSFDPDREQYENTFINTPYTIGEDYRKNPALNPTIEDYLDWQQSKYVSSLVNHRVNGSLHRLYYTKRLSYKKLNV
ncbi:MAG: family 16 glycosylhydrolase [Saprospiraceae bacterium]